MEPLMKVLVTIAAALAGGLIAVAGVASLAYIFIKVRQAVMRRLARHVERQNRQAAGKDKADHSLDPRRPLTPLTAEQKDRAAMELKWVEAVKRTRNAPNQ